MRKLKAPHVDRDDGSDGDGSYLTLTWCYGPQGHPASMRIVLWQGDGEVELWRIGPGNTLVEYQSDLLAVAERLHRLGRAVDARFGTAWDWWMCKPNCTGHRCASCRAVKAEAEGDTAAFMTGGGRL